MEHENHEKYGGHEEYKVKPKRNQCHGHTPTGIKGAINLKYKRSFQTSIPQHETDILLEIYIAHKILRTKSVFNV